MQTKMKRVFALVLALTLMISVAACGKKDEPAATEKPAAATAAPETKAPETKAPETEAPTEAEKVEEKADEAALAGDINVYSRDATSGTREAFESVIGFKDELLDNVVEVASNGDMATSVGSDEYAIGYVSLTTDFAANNLKPVNYEGVEPNDANKIDGSYALSRPFNLVTRASGDFGDDEQEELVAAFVDFMMNSKEGREAVYAAGGIVDVEGGQPWDELKDKYPVLEQDNSSREIRTSGSTSVNKTLQAALETFSPLAGGVVITPNQTGSGDGYKRVLGEEKDGPNKADIGFASRAFKDEEDVADALVSGSYCLDAVVVVVEASNPIADLTKDQLKAIFTGEVTTWEDVK